MKPRHTLFTRDLPALLAALVLAGSLGASFAEAGPRDKSRTRSKQERVEKRRSKPEVRKERGKPEVRREKGKARARQQKQRPRARRDADRDSRREGRVAKRHRDGDAPHVVRRGKPVVTRPRHAPRGPSGHPRVHHPPRHGHRGQGRVIVRHWPRQRSYCSPIRTNWWHRAPRLIVATRPYYFNASLGFYLGGLALRFEIGDYPPPGYHYYDPYCGHWFPTLSAFRSHGYDHEVALTLIPVRACFSGGYVDPGYEEDWEYWD